MWNTLTFVSNSRISWNPRAVYWPAKNSLETSKDSLLFIYNRLLLVGPTAVNSSVKALGSRQAVETEQQLTKHRSTLAKRRNLDKLCSIYFWKNVGRYYFIKRLIDDVKHHIG